MGTTVFDRERFGLRGPGTVLLAATSTASLMAWLLLGPGVEVRS